MSETVSTLSSYADAAPVLQPIAVPAFLSLIGLALVAPYISRLTRKPDAEWAGNATMLLLLFGAVILTVLRPGGFLPWSLLLLVPLIGSGTYLVAGGAVALMLFAPVIWWWFEPGWQRVAIFAVLAIGFAGLPRWATTEYPLQDHGPPLRNRLALVMACGAVAAFTAGLLTGPMNSWTSGQLAWHHWGAYLSPVQGLLSGGIPYRDYPVQYGMGPTLLLAGVCGNNCWNGIYWSTVIANSLQVALLCMSVALLTGAMNRGMQILALAAMLFASILWTAYPAVFANGVMTPSVSGMRFLPVTALVFHILYCEHRARPVDWRGHLVWLACMLWCTETAAYGSIIWWPYLAMRAVEDITDRKTLILSVARQAVIGIIAAVVVVTAMLLAYRAAFGLWLDPVSFFAYMNNLPTALPINPIGPVWLALASIAIAVLLLLTSPPAREGRQIYVSLLAYVAAGSYFISRSHDNNILNLLPYLVLLLCAIAATLQSKTPGKVQQFIAGFARVTLAAMLAFVCTFDTAAWQKAVADGKLLQVGDTSLVDRMAGHDGTTDPILSKEAVFALDQVRRETPYDIVLLDELKVMVFQAPGMGWTGANNLANTIPLPDALVKQYIHNGARQYRRSGWAVFHTEQARGRADLFRAGYNVAEERVYGPYSAYRLVPR